MTPEGAPDATVPYMAAGRSERHAPMRVQATLFLPPPVHQVVEEIRERWDPGMAQLVAAHVTLVHQVDEPSGFLQRLTRIAAATAPIELLLTHAACWGSPGGGIYMAVEDSLGGIAGLRHSLLVTDPPGVVYTPHVTLLHPRTVTPTRARAAWTLLHDLQVDQPVTIDEVALVQKRGQRCELVNQVRLTG